MNEILLSARKVETRKYLANSVNDCDTEASSELQNKLSVVF